MGLGLMETATAHHPRSVLDRSSEAFTELRPLLFSIAYRMVGSAMDAEDLVQDAYVRWREVSDAEVRSPRAYLATMVTRLSINQLRSARVQREVYVGPWLPEPSSGPAVRAASISRICAGVWPAASCGK